VSEDSLYTLITINDNSLWMVNQGGFVNEVN